LDQLRERNMPGATGRGRRFDITPPECWKIAIEIDYIFGI